MGSAAAGLSGAATGATMGAAFGPIGMGVGALAGGLLGGLAGGGSSSGGGGSASGSALGNPNETNQRVNLDIENNNIGSPININIGGRQNNPDASIGGQEAMGYLPSSQIVDMLPYGSINGNVSYRMADSFVDPIANGGWLPPFASPDGALPSQPMASLGKTKTLLYVGAAAVLLVLIVRR